MEYRVHRRLPSPRAAIVGFSGDEADRISGLVASPILGSDARFLSRPWDEIDVAIVNGSPEDNIPSEVPLIIRAPVPEGYGTQLVEAPFFLRGPALRRSSTSAVEVLSVKQDHPVLDAAINALIREFPEKGLHVFELDRLAWKQHFISNPRGEVMAGEYSRDDSGTIGWAIPHYVEDFVVWVRLFLSRVHELDDSRVPKPPPDWVPWDTAAETRLVNERAEILDEGQAVFDAYLEKLHAKDEEIAEARKAAAKGHDRLLTEDGDSLKEAARDALEVIGFSVVDADEQLEPGVGKREDLWVIRDNSTAIVEVKGYSRGASSGDLAKSKDYQITFLGRSGERPVAQWHIVNANRGLDPNARPRLFIGHEDLVNSLGIVVVDTRDLFRIVTDVELEKLSPEDAQTLLWEAEGGFWSYP